jgi:hypothetical protein
MSRRISARLALAGALTALTLAASGAASAWAQAKLCIPKAASRPVLTPNGKGRCPSIKRVRYSLAVLGGGNRGPEGKRGAAGKTGPAGKPGPEGKNTFSATEIATIKGVLPFIKVLEKGVGGKPTIVFSGVNVQVVSGAGKTNAAVNGLGNLVIGYDENEGKHSQTGSHDLILGEEQTFTSFGGIVAGRFSTVSGEFASVLGGFKNTAEGKLSSVLGKKEQTAKGEYEAIP